MEIFNPDDKSKKQNLELSRAKMEQNKQLGSKQGDIEGLNAQRNRWDKSK